MHSTTLLSMAFSTLFLSVAASPFNKRQGWVRLSDWQSFFRPNTDFTFRHLPVLTTDHLQQQSPKAAAAPTLQLQMTSNRGATAQQPYYPATQTEIKCKTQSVSKTLIAMCARVRAGAHLHLHLHPRSHQRQVCHKEHTFPLFHNLLFCFWAYLEET